MHFETTGRSLADERTGGGGGLDGVGTSVRFEVEATTASSEVGMWYK